MLSYIEVRFAPELSMDKGLTVAETIDAVCRRLRQAQEEFGIVAKASSLWYASIKSRFNGSYS